MQPNHPITVILDNVKYQKCSLVFDYAKIFDIQWLYLRPYSLNFNLIERVWNFVKRCLYSKYDLEFDPFKKAILLCFA
jgi:hypothetical protein